MNPFKLIFQKVHVLFWRILVRICLIIEIIAKNFSTFLINFKRRKKYKKIKKNIIFTRLINLKYLKAQSVKLEWHSRRLKLRFERCVRAVRDGVFDKGQGRTLIRMKASIPTRSFATTRIFNLEYDRLSIDSSFKPHYGKYPFGLWQFKFLKSVGLKKHNKILDVGCGDLREGVPLINFLEPEKYFGLDQSQSAISQGLLSLTEDQITDKKPVFLMGYDFKISNFLKSNDIDFAWANSVWTHLDLSVIITSLSEIYKILKPGGKFLVTFFDIEFEKMYQPGAYREQNDRKSFVKKKEVTAKYTYINRNPYHYPHEILFKLAYKTGFKKVEVLKEKTPKRQSILSLTK